MAAYVLTLLALVSSVLGQDQCLDGRTPIYVDFHDRHVNNSEGNPDANIQYGLFIGVGTPAQNQSLWPSLVHNETTFSSPSFCDNSTNPSCREQTHGTYQPEDSERYSPNDTFVPLDSNGIGPTQVGGTGSDTLNVYTHYFDPSPPNVTLVEDFPVTQLTDYSSDESPWFGPSGHLGLGPSAPILSRLVALSLITTRSFGLYVGTAYPRPGGAINGSLTLGGYDSGRFTGTSHNFTLDNVFNLEEGETPFRVTIDSLTLQDANNNNATTRLNNDSFSAYLTTDQFSMTFPTDMTDAFVSATGAGDPTNNDFSEPTFPLPSNANFSLTITIQNGPTVEIPWYEMRNASNASPISPPRSTNSTSTSNTALLGALFLSHLYLTVNYDATPPAFYLAEALPHGPYVMTQPLCADTIPVMAAQVRLSSWRANGVIGAVLGGVIGGIGLAFAAWWCFVKVQQRKLSKLGEAEDEEIKGAALVIRNGVVKGVGGSGAGSRSPRASGRGGKRAALVGIMKGRRNDGKGKGKGVAYGGIDRPKKISWSGSSENSGSDEADRGGYDMQQFSPVAIPAAYGYPTGDAGASHNHTQQQPQQQQHHHSDPLTTNPPQQHSSHHHPSVLAIGQAISSPSDTQAPPLRSISPVSPMSTLFSSDNEDDEREHFAPATQPAGFPLPAAAAAYSQSQSYSNSNSNSPSPPSRLQQPPLDLQPPPTLGGAGAGGDGGLVSLTSSLRTSETGGSGSGGSLSSSSPAAGSRPELRLKTAVGSGFNGEARTAKKLRLVPVNGGDGRGGSVRVERVGGGREGGEAGVGWRRKMFPA
ncbi:uncharacterized protein HMPREF1541_10211 [Cyphellophora europaea CBS 101466]|uniref:Peptidase A1 domain-containing protein n=1 Tax=Cyphellophora europaea (strain CBS 101466) TaxID=1220924 RepID=W2S753_CYPE1|nr:uncharacterized protein HMPREF1541_10211 [Cyphellophora europaea CBS 101466]ETN44541.1 hypothetical protein HMPREF1541_10211 [Cyphellophora europaea CBS 101466]